MNQIIDQDPQHRQDGRSSSIYEPVDYSNSRKNVQAPGLVASTSDRWELRDLNKSLNPNLPKLEREYFSWKFRNPDETDSCPSRYTPVLDSWERKALAEDFRISNKSELDAIKEVKKQLERDMPGFNRRRSRELELAAYIKREISPLGLIEYQRGDLLYYDDPNDMADRLTSCRKSGTIGIKPNNERLIIFDYKCGFSKICPDESRAESKRISETYIPAIDAFLKQHRGNTFQFMVLTLPNYPAGYLKAGKKEINKMFRRLLERVCCKHIAGCLAIQEDPLSAHGDWNIHLNVMVALDGPLNWKAVRESWGYNIHFESEHSMTQKTTAKLLKKKMDVSKLDRITVLTHAINELCKYAGAPVSEKSADKSDQGLSEAPSMTDWPPELWREWWAANKGYRRTRSYGVLYDPEGYRWRVAVRSSRSVWVRKAGLDDGKSDLEWRKRVDGLSKADRDALRDVMGEKEILDMSLVKWIGTIRYIKGEGYRVLIDLILADKLGDPDKSAWSACPNYPTGPPPDAPEGGDLMASWEEYCIEAEI